MFCIGPFRSFPSVRRRRDGGRDIFVAIGGDDVVVDLDGKESGTTSSKGEEEEEEEEEGRKSATNEKVGTTGSPTTTIETPETAVSSSSSSPSPSRGSSCRSVAEEEEGGGGGANRCWRPIPCTFVVVDAMRFRRVRRKDGASARSTPASAVGRRDQSQQRRRHPREQRQQPQHRRTCDSGEEEEEGCGGRGADGGETACLPLRRASAAARTVPSSAPRGGGDRPSVRVVWRSAVDATTGRRYYYDEATRLSQWEKPAELQAMEGVRRGGDDDDRQRRRTSAESLAFFRDMERNVRLSLERGDLIPPSPSAASNTASGPPASSPASGGPPAIHAIAGRLEGREGSGNEGSSSETDSERSRTPILEGTVLEDQKGSGRRRRHVRRNTGGTIYVESTLTSPDVEATIRCVCTIFLEHMDAGDSDRPPRSPVSVRHASLELEVFDDDHDPTDSSLGAKALRRIGEATSGFFDAIGGGGARDHASREWSRPDPHCRCGPAPTAAAAPPRPSLDDVVRFYREVHRRGKMERDAVIISLVYVERLVRSTAGALRPAPRNWRSVLFASMVLASKVWDDLSMWNVDFSNVCQRRGRGAGSLAAEPMLRPFHLARINRLELAALLALDFDVAVSAGEYACYYFRLRSMEMKGPAAALAGKEREGRHCPDRAGTVLSPARPLDMEGARKLGACGLQYRCEAARGVAAGASRRRRTRSFGDLEGLVCDAAGGEGPEGQVAWGSARYSAVSGRRQRLVCLEQMVSM